MDKKEKGKDCEQFDYSMIGLFQYSVFMWDPSIEKYLGIYLNVYTSGHEITSI